MSPTAWCCEQLQPSSLRRRPCPSRCEQPQVHRPPCEDRLRCCKQPRRDTFTAVSPSTLTASSRRQRHAQSVRRSQRVVRAVEVNDLESSAPRSASVTGRLADKSAGRSNRSVKLRSRPYGPSQHVRSTPHGAHDTLDLATCAASRDTRNRVRSATYQGGPRRFVASHSPFPSARPKPRVGLTSPPFGPKASGAAGDRAEARPPCLAAIDLRTRSPDMLPLGLAQRPRRTMPVGSGRSRPLWRNMTEVMLHFRGVCHARRRVETRSTCLHVSGRGEVALRWFSVRSTDAEASR